VVKLKELSPLISITTLEHWKKLEPNAPPPEKRFKSIANLTEAGYKVFLYLRPLIPGLVDYEIEELLSEAKKAGAVGVVSGGFRVTVGIMDTMKKAGLNVSEVANRAPKADKTQRYIYTQDLEDKVIRSAKDKKLIALRSTKCAVAYACKVPCTSLYWVYNPQMCTKCKTCWDEVPKFTPKETEKIVKEIITPEIITEVKSVASDGKEKGRIEIKVREKEPEVPEPNLVAPWKPRTLETYFRQPIRIRK
jgi:hypothetical protein